MFQRRGGVYYWQDNQTGQQGSLGTKDTYAAEKLLHAKQRGLRATRSQPCPCQGLRIGHDPKMPTRTWREVIAEMASHGKASTQKRCGRAMNSKSLDPIRDKTLLATTSDALLCILRTGRSAIYETPWFNELLPRQPALAGRRRPAFPIRLAAGIFETLRERRPRHQFGEREAKLERVSPKAGMILTPFRGTTVRAAYTESVTGPSFDESIRLEPTQVAGFSQSFRNVVSESLVGELGGSCFRNYGVSLEQKLPSLTYLGLEFSRIEQNVDRVVGVFDYFPKPFAAVLSSVKERIEYCEDMLLASINQLVGENWVF